MRLKQYLNELFNTKVKLSSIKGSEISYVTKYETQGIKMQVTFHQNQNMFGRLDGDDPYSEYEIMFEPTNGQIQNLDMKQVISVFSGVKQAVEKFIKEKDPVLFYFSPEHTKLKPIYDKFVKELKRKLKGYEYKLKDGYEHVFYRL